MSKKNTRNPLVTALEEGIEELRTRRHLRVRHVEIRHPPKFSAERIAAIRQYKLKASQTIFAEYLGVSPSTVRAWEQRQRRPSMSARRLIQVAAERPEIIRELACR